MKMFPVIGFVSLLVGAGAAAAASPKRPPSYNQNRFGAYAVGTIGMTSYTSDQAGTEAYLLDFMTQGNPAQNLQAGLQTRPDNKKTWVRNSRGARIGNQSDDFSIFHAGN